MRATARNKKSNEIIDIDIDVLVLHLDNKALVELHYDEAKLLIKIIETSPKLSSYEHLLDNVFKYQHGDGQAFMRKKLHSTRRKLNPYIPDLIETIRGRGVRLSNHWEKIQTGNDQSAFVQNEIWVGALQNIKSILENTLSIAATLEFQYEETDDKSAPLLTLRKGDRAAEIEKNKVEFSKNAVALLGIVNVQEQALFGVVQRLMLTLESYISVSRSGAGISEEKWRELFATELSHHYSSLASLLKNLFRE